MNILRQGNTIIGEMDAEGVVYALQGSTQIAVGHAETNGSIFSVRGKVVGFVDEAGTVCDPAGSPVGMVDSRGSVTLHNMPVGSVQGEELRLAGAALLLLFDAPYVRPPIPPDPDPDPDPLRKPNWIPIVIGLGVSLLLFIFLIAFILATAILWAGMLLLTCISTWLLANAMSKRFPTEDLAALTVVQQPTKHGSKMCLSDEAIRPLLRFYPFLFLALAPALFYGIVIGAASLTANYNSDTTAELIFTTIAYFVSAVISLIVAHKLLRRRLNVLLVAQKSSFASAGLSEGAPIRAHPRPWNRLALTAGGMMVLAVLIGGKVVQKAMFKKQIMTVMLQMNDYAWAMREYLQSTNGRFDLSNADFRTKLAPYLRHAHITTSSFFYASSDQISFAFNDTLAGMNIADIPEPTSVIMFYEFSGSEAAANHENVLNVAFVDGHVTGYWPRTPRSLKWQPEREQPQSPVPVQSDSPSVQEKNPAVDSETVSHGHGTQAALSGEEADLKVHKDPPSTIAETKDNMQASPQMLQTTPETAASTLEKRIQAASERNLNEIDLAGRSARELSLMRNGPYARHGYRFQTASIRAYFEHQPWYRPATGNMDQISLALSPLEHRNTKFILDYQTKKGLLK